MLKPSHVRMITAVAIVFVLLVAAFGAWAEDAKKMFTVGEIVGITGALKSLKTYPATDKAGAAIQLPYKFDGPTLMNMAMNISKGDAVLKAYQDAVNGLIMQFSDGGSKVPDGKLAEFNLQASRMLDKQTGVEMIRIKEADLKLTDQPVPAETLAMLIPILDR